MTATMTSASDPAARVASAAAPSAARDVVLHAARVCAWGAALVAAIVVDVGARVGGVFVDVPGVFVDVAVTAAATAGFFFAVFSLFHDVAHGALGLPPRLNEAVLALTSVPLWMSAHGQRQHHLRHHARPLADDDDEGAGALMPLWRAALTGPWASVHMRLKAFVTVPDKVRPWVVAENVANVATVVVVVVVDDLELSVAFGVCALLQLTMNAWASHIPHRAPKWLLQLAATFSWTRSPAVLSLVYHLEHHAHPRVPCAQLRPAVDVASPLVAAAAAAKPWAQLAPDRPRPRARRMVGAA
jgi:fatty acid desaturase